MQSGVRKYGACNVRHVSTLQGRIDVFERRSAAKVKTTPRNNNNKRSDNNNANVATVTVYNSY